MKEPLYGRNPMLEAIRNNRELSSVMVTAGNGDIIGLLEKKGYEYRIVSKREIDSRLPAYARHQGVFALEDKYHYTEITDLIDSAPDSLLVMLDGLEDPRNLGAIIRTCEAGGVTGVIIPGNRSVDVTASVMKSATGATEFVRIAKVTNLNRTISLLKERGYWIVGAEADPENRCFWNVDLDMRICLVIGSEGKGLSRLVRENCDFLLRIPMRGKIASLNAAVSTALLIYEIRRQQNK